MTCEPVTTTSQTVDANSPIENPPTPQTACIDNPAENNAHSPNEEEPMPIDTAAVIAPIIESESQVDANDNDETIVLDDSLDTSSRSDEADEDESPRRPIMEVKKITKSIMPEGYEEFAKDLIVVNRKVELGKPAYTIIPKSGSMIITAKSKEDIDRVTEEYFGPNSKLKRMSIIARAAETTLKEEQRQEDESAIKECNSDTASITVESKEVVTETQAEIANEKPEHQINDEVNYLSI